MRIICLSAVLFFSLNCFAQLEFSKQFRNIIRDTAMGFPKFRGRQEEITKLDTAENSTNYESTVTIPGTTKNFIVIYEVKINTGDTIGAINFSYHALVADSLKKRKAEKLCSEWKNEIASILGDGFTQKKYQLRSWSPVKYGWTFFRKDLDVTIESLAKGATKLDMVWLTISYRTYKVR